jgi:hypothetical protein
MAKLPKSSSESESDYIFSLKTETASDANMTARGCH